MTGSRISALWYFESVNLYKILCPHKVKKLDGTHEFKTYQKGDFIYMPQDKSTHIYLIAEGRVKIGHFLEDGKEVVASILTNGELFGELAVAGEEHRRDFAQAVTATRICPLTLDELKDLMFENRELSFKILKLVGYRLMKLERKLELLVYKDARTRIVEFLKDTAAWKGKQFGTETLISTKLTHKDIGSLTGTSRQTVTTVMNQLKEENQLTFDRRRILIRNLETLR